jgi:hypothetical protein
LLLAIYGLTLSILDGYRWWLKLALVTAMAFLPKARRLLVTVATILFTSFLWFNGSNLTRMINGPQPTHTTEVTYIVLPFVLLITALMWFAGRYPKSMISRKPIFSLLGVCGVLLAFAHFAPSGFPRFAIWALLLTFSSYFW